MIGEQFSRLFVISEMGKTASGQRRFYCRCECGNVTVVRVDHLRAGKSKSCGCLRTGKKKGTPSGNRRHGDRYAQDGRPAPEYVTFYRMRDRCENPKNNRFEHYGARGVKVSPRWRDSYETFLADMGRKPSPEHSIDRIDTDGDYEPGNCRWATRIEQARNKRERATV